MTDTKDRMTELLARAAALKLAAGRTTNASRKAQLLAEAAHLCADAEELRTGWQER